MTYLFMHFSYVLNTAVYLLCFPIHVSAAYRSDENIVFSSSNIPLIINRISRRLPNFKRFSREIRTNQKRGCLSTSINYMAVVWPFFILIVSFDQIKPFISNSKMFYSSDTWIWSRIPGVFRGSFFSSV